jgi:hypothetical protein
MRLIEIREDDYGEFRIQNSVTQIADNSELNDMPVQNPLNQTLAKH